MRKRENCCSLSACRSGRAEGRCECGRSSLTERPRLEARDDNMATTAKIAKEQRKPKYKIRLRNRCHLCGRPRAYMRKFGLCRLCFRKLALEGDITGVTKSSW